MVDEKVTAQLQKTDKFQTIPVDNDLKEHSLEMHLPFIWKRLEQTLAAGQPRPTLVPILVGEGDGPAEKAYAALLLPYLRDRENAFVVSSDFCHWGKDHRYRVYCPGLDLARLRALPAAGSAPDADTPLYKSIEALDKAAFAAIATGVHDNFVKYLGKTKNTVCGRHPIGVTMAALEMLAKERGSAAAGAGDAGAKGKGSFTFVRYKRSSDVETANDSSVSYAAAYAVL